MPAERRGEFARYLRAPDRPTASHAGLLPLVARDGTLRIWQYNNIIDSDADEPYVLGHAQDITERRNYEQKLRELSTIDPLTGCHNRRYLDEHAARAAAMRAGAASSSISTGSSRSTTPTATSAAIRC